MRVGQLPHSNRSQVFAINTAVCTAQPNAVVAWPDLLRSVYIGNVPTWVARAHCLRPCPVGLASDIRSSHQRSIASRITGLVDVGGCWAGKSPVGWVLGRRRAHCKQAPTHCWSANSRLRWIFTCLNKFVIGSGLGSQQRLVVPTPACAQLQLTLHTASHPYPAVPHDVNECVHVRVRVCAATCADHSPTAEPPK